MNPPQQAKVEKVHLEAAEQDFRSPCPRCKNFGYEGGRKVLYGVIWEPIGSLGGKYIQCPTCQGARKRVEEKGYLPWAEAGGPNECTHGYAEGIPCPKCDAAQPQETLEGKTDYYPILVEGRRLFIEQNRDEYNRLGLAARAGKSDDSGLAKFEKACDRAGYQAVASFAVRQKDKEIAALSKNQRTFDFAIETMQASLNDSYAETKRLREALERINRCVTAEKSGYVDQLHNIIEAVAKEASSALAPSQDGKGEK